MCDHVNIVVEKRGSWTCVDCSVYYDQNLCIDFDDTHNGPKVTKVKSSESDIQTILGKDYGIYDKVLTSLTKEIYEVVVKNKMVKKSNNKAVLCASLYYASCYLKKPQTFNTLLTIFGITRKKGSKGLKLCQIAVQESSNLNIKNLKDTIHCFTPDHRENLLDLISRYNVPLKYFENIEQLMIEIHLKKRKTLNDQINTLWLSCIFFWVTKINPYVHPEDFVSINNNLYKINLSQLKADVSFLNKTTSATL